MPITVLERLIADEIVRDGPITFARFMTLALYHPQLGYYAGGGMGREPLGWEGDYFTSGDLTPLWGWAIARQLHQMWELLDRPATFDVLEPGAGRGLLAIAVWRYAIERAPDWAAVLHYTLADRAPAGSPLRAVREEQLTAGLHALGVQTDCTHWDADVFARFADHRLTGCIVSNELVDALPAHVIEKRGDMLAEVYVALDRAGGRLVELLGPPSSTEVAGYLDRFGVTWRTFPDGWRAEVCLAAETWLRAIAGLVRRGFVLTIDYGASARRLYSRDRRRGTLMAYTHHQLGERTLANPGAQDLTAHVNFSALAKAGRFAGLRTAGLTTQADLLERLGIRDEAAAVTSWRAPGVDAATATSQSALEYLRRSSQRAAVRVLLDPARLGGFKALVQHRGVPGAGKRLLGLKR
jgi:SAM-dependent MidA family methyltransferase